MRRIHYGRVDSPTCCVKSVNRGDTFFGPALNTGKRPTVLLHTYECAVVGSSALHCGATGAAGAHIITEVAEILRHVLDSNYASGLKHLLKMMANKIQFDWTFDNSAVAFGRVGVTIPHWIVHSFKPLRPRKASSYHAPYMCKVDT
jgi:hypothetical protein